MGYRRFIEAGRVAYVNYGEDTGKAAVIVDILDSHRVVVDGAHLGFPRVSYPIKRLTLTNLKVPKLCRGARTSTVTKAAKAFELEKKWAETATAKNMAKKETRSNLNDLDRFKVMINRKNKAYKVRQLAKKALKK
eukprot:NODE_7246_length_466_cov_23.992806_g6419_i0.p1 GENE.NODE_7246_length_466_cov_23.992806_g6419_i0~~NODE_7246_length_466_cov_23.992806_g6419_i0.p1  ORF type:complete len:148 (+),score=34.89 NODE_7246_length_466_cov_23.992806_g6419_i0:41-445(+)